MKISFEPQGFAFQTEEIMRKIRGGLCVCYEKPELKADRDAWLNYIENKIQRALVAAYCDGIHDLGDLFVDTSWDLVFDESYHKTLDGKD